MSALLVLAAALPARGQSAPLDEPIPWQDAAPLALPFLQLPFESPALVEPGRLQIGVRTIYSNDIARTQSPDLQVAYHMETAQPSLVVRYGVRPGLELHLEAAGVFELNASLDPVIKEVESWFNTLNRLRTSHLSEVATFRITRSDGRGATFQGPAAAFGDVWLGVKGTLREQDGWSPGLAWRAALKLPTGRFPFGSGVVEEGVGFLAGAGAGRTHLWLAADLLVPNGSVSSARLQTRPHPAFQLAVTRVLGSRFALLLQGSTHGSALRYMHLSEIDGWTFYVLAGARLAPTPSFSVGFGVVENLVVTERGTDIAGVLDVSWRF
jgi:hypothetical protein